MSYAGFVIGLCIVQQYVNKELFN